MTIVQIGCNEGKDEVSILIKYNYHNLNRCILIDGNLEALKRCVDNYSNIDINNKLEFYHYVISNNKKQEKTIFYIPSPANIKSDSEASSTSFEHIKKMGLENFIETEAPNKEINQLFDDLNLQKIDHLFIDVEGQDCSLIRAINFNKTEIQSIFFEGCHADGLNLKGEQFKETIKYLIENDYLIHDLTTNDIYCYKNTTVDRYNQVEGYFHQEELYNLLDVHLPFNKESCILEVGHWLGRSTIYLSHLLAISKKKTKIFSVDDYHHYNDQNLISAEKNLNLLYNKTIQQKCYENLISSRVIDNVTLIKCNIEEFFLHSPVRFFDAIIINAPKNYLTSFKLLELAYIHLKSEGIMLFSCFNNQKDIDRERAFKDFVNLYPISYKRYTSGFFFKRQ